MTLEERFWRKVRKTDGCWMWDATRLERGYGVISNKGRFLRAHRVSYELHYGSIPTDMCVLHSCDNPSCVRPDHLRLGSRADNAADKVAKKRHAFGERHGKAKVSDQQVLEMRQLYRTGQMRVCDLARKYGLRDASICLILAGINFKHLAYDGNLLPHYGSDEWKEHIAEAQRGRLFTPEHLTNLRVAHAARRGTERSIPWNKGVPMSEETRRKVSEARNGKGGRCLTPEAEALRCQRIATSRRGMKFTDEHRRHLSEAHHA